MSLESKRMHIRRKVKKNIRLSLIVLVVGCNSITQSIAQSSTETYADVRIAGAMKNVMWKGELEGRIHLDTISDKNGLYGLGPLSHLKGELFIKNGESYVSKVISDSTMSVEKKFDVSAPFFVYGNVNEWDVSELPPEVQTIKELEQFIDKKTIDYKRPFVFKIIGEISNAIIHIQNLPEGTKVSSPKEAHTGQIKYNIGNELVEIIGFFSTQHHGVFTHHDSNVHMHLITASEDKMGHLDEVRCKKMKLYLPKN